MRFPFGSHMFNICRNAQFPCSSLSSILEILAAPLYAGLFVSPQRNTSPSFPFFPIPLSSSCWCWCLQYDDDDDNFMLIVMIDYGGAYADSEEGCRGGWGRNRGNDDLSGRRDALKPLCSNSLLSLMLLLLLLLSTLCLLMLLLMLTAVRK